LRKRRVPPAHLNAACDAYRWRHTDMHMPILHIAMKNASAMVGTALPVDSVAGMMINDER
jgi:hypothetical protein